VPRAYVCACGVISRDRLCPACARERAARSAYYKTDHWRGISRECKERDGGRCVACNSDHQVTAHHVEPRDNSTGSPAPTPLDRVGNLVTLCSSCHSTLEAERRDGLDDTDLIRLTRTLTY
jgi:5-methylcytosine-specific restriction endonuclease McrA